MAQPKEDPQLPLKEPYNSLQRRARVLKSALYIYIYPLGLEKMKQRGTPLWQVPRQLFSRWPVSLAWACLCNGCKYVFFGDWYDSVCMYIYIYRYVNMYTHIYIYIWTCRYRFTCLNKYIYIYTHTYAWWWRKVQAVAHIPLAEPPANSAQSPHRAWFSTPATVLAVFLCAGSRHFSRMLP